MSLRENPIFPPTQCPRVQLAHKPSHSFGLGLDNGDVHVVGSCPPSSVIARATSSGVLTPESPGREAFRYQYSVAFPETGSVASTQPLSWRPSRHRWVRLYPAS